MRGCSGLDGFSGTQCGDFDDRKAGFGDFGGDRRDDRRGGTPWEKKPPATGGFGKPAPRGDFAKPATGGKVFVPRDAKKRAYKPAR